MGGAATLVFTPLHPGNPVSKVSGNRGFVLRRKLPSHKTTSQLPHALPQLCKRCVASVRQRNSFEFTWICLRKASESADRSGFDPRLDRAAGTPE